jgi:hypothetical protein
MELPFRWNDAEGRVLVEVDATDDPVAFGCPEAARGFPYCRATVEHPGVGYADVLGWVQLVDSSAHDEGFHLDCFERIGPAPHPFALYGWTPTFFDAPHTDEPEDWDFLAHSFLCGLGGELHEFRREARAVLGFSWGFSRRDGKVVEWVGPSPLAPEDWDAHRDYLGERYGKWEWRFAPGFVQHPLRP